MSTSTEHEALRRVAVALPQLAKPRLAAEVPALKLDRDVAALDPEVLDVQVIPR